MKVVLLVVAAPEAPLERRQAENGNISVQEVVAFCSVVGVSDAGPAAEEVCCAIL